MKKINTLKSFKCKSLQGKINVPGDKSISHRALILSAISIGESKISGLLESEDVLNTMKALKKLGVMILKQKKKISVLGNGGIFKKEFQTLYLGNSGTGVRLIAGLLSTKNINVTMIGDDSLSKRPMMRIVKPLREMGADIVDNGGKLPIKFLKSKFTKNIKYKLEIGSAQVKSAILLAASNVKGITTIEEMKPSRDHSENMLKYFGARIEINKKKQSKLIKLYGPCILKSKYIEVPGDFSSAAFIIIAVILARNSNVTIKSVGLNYYRVGLLEVMKAMNANIKVSNKKTINGEVVGDINVISSQLVCTKIKEDISTRLIDEFPSLFVACSFATGVSELNGLEELKFKESNRLDAMIEALTSCGVKVEYKKNKLFIFGKKKHSGGCLVNTYSDHRIAMAMLVFGMISEKPVTIDDMSMIKTSFPGFQKLFGEIGAKIKIIQKP